MTGPSVASGGDKTGSATVRGRSAVSVDSSIGSLPNAGGGGFDCAIWIPDRTTEERRA
jgi:hypothetical protein